MNPYEPPHEERSPTKRNSRFRFLSFRIGSLTIVEWLVVCGIVVIILGLTMPHISTHR